MKNVLNVYLTKFNQSMLKVTNTDRDNAQCQRILEMIKIPGKHANRTRAITDCDECHFANHRLTPVNSPHQFS